MRLGCVGAPGVPNYPYGAMKREEKDQRKGKMLLFSVPGGVWVLVL